MFKASVVTDKLAFAQFLMLLVHGGAYLFGLHVSWFVTLWPLELVLASALLFWIVFAGLCKAVS